MPDDIRWEWLDRYFAGECTPAEEQEIQRWIAESAERRQIVERLREVWARAARQPDRRWDARAAWQRLAPTLDVPPAADAPRRGLTLIPGAADRSPARRPLYTYAMRVAAAIAVVATGAGIWQLASRVGTSAVEQAVAFREYVTPRGQRATFALADGTQVMLGPASTLRAPRDFGAGGRRDVYLEGEALFEVTHDEQRPFVVHAAHGVAEDLGTRFVVTAYPGDTAMRVVVEEGVVALRGSADSATVASAPAERILKPGDLGLVSRGGRITTAHNVVLDEYLGWTTGQLIFRDAPVRDVVAVLARWYDVDFRLADAETGARRVTLTTDPAQPLTEVVTALTVPLGLQATWSGRTIHVGP